MADALKDIALVAADSYMQQRVASAIAQQDNIGEFPVPDAAVAETTAYTERFAWAAAPTFAERYRYALDTDVENPGNDASVIPDADIIAWVQARWPKPPPSVPDNELPE